MEELKVIIEMLNGLGEGAESAFALYMAVKFLRVLLLTVLLGGLFWGAYKLANKALNAHSFGCLVMDIFDEDIFYSSARARVIEKIRRNK
jgi:hypothetical protein